MKKVLVTGATGFIGSHCVPLLLKQGYEVHAVSSRPTPGAVDKAFQWHQADLLDLQQICDVVARAQPTHLLHFAWVTTPREYWQSPENFRWVQASIEIFRRFWERGGGRAVAAGTCAEYDWNASFCSETSTPLHPKTPYGVCKHAVQILLHSMASVMGGSAAWGRIFFPYGPREHCERLTPTVIRGALRRQPIKCTHGEQVRDFVYVEDVAEAFVALLESDATGPFNIASGRPVKVRDYVLTLARKLDATSLIQFGAVPPPPHDPQVVIGDTNRITSQVGWTPRHDLDHGLDKTIEWWRQQLSETGVDIA